MSVWARWNQQLLQTSQWMMDKYWFSSLRTSKTHFSVAMYPADFTKWTPVVKIPVQNGTGHPTEPVLLHTLLKQEVEGLSLAVCWTVLKCLFEFARLCNGVGVNIGCQTGANDSLKIYKGEQSPDGTHVYRKLICTVPVIIREQWCERVQGNILVWIPAHELQEEKNKNAFPWH